MEFCLPRFEVKVCAFCFAGVDGAVGANDRSGNSGLCVLV